MDQIESHEPWSKDIEETQGTALNFPLIADTDKSIANLYGMIHPNASDTLTVRSVFVIGPDKKVKLTLNYPASTGRNFDEVIRVIDSLQLTAKHQVATPVNWKNGDDVIIVNSVTDEQAKAKYPGGFKTVKPYLRTVAQPSVKLFLETTKPRRASLAARLPGFCCLRRCLSCRTGPLRAGRSLRDGDPLRGGCQDCLCRPTGGATRSFHTPRSGRCPRRALLRF